MTELAVSRDSNPYDTTRSGDIQSLVGWSTTVTSLSTLKFSDDQFLVELIKWIIMNLNHSQM